MGGISSQFQPSGASIPGAGLRGISKSTEPTAHRLERSLSRSIVAKKAASRSIGVRGFLGFISVPGWEGSQRQNINLCVKRSTTITFQPPRRGVRRVGGIKADQDLDQLE